MEKLLYEWNFQDTRNRGPLWYIIGSSIALGIIIWGFFTQQYGMSFIILLISGLFYFIENNSDEYVHVSIHELGIKLNQSFYDYGSIENYSIVYDGENALYLRLHLNKKGLRKIDISLNNEILKDIQPLLSGFLAVGESEELTFTERLIILLKL